MLSKFKELSEEEGLLAELEFRTLLKQFGGEMSSIDRGAYRLVTTAQELEELRAAMAAADRFALDTETTSLDSLQADLVGLSFCADEKEAWYVPVAHNILEPQLRWEEVKEVVAPLIESPDVGVTGQQVRSNVGGQEAGKGRAFLVLQVTVANTGDRPCNRRRQCRPSCPAGPWLPGPFVCKVYPASPLLYRPGRTWGLSYEPNKRSSCRCSTRNEHKFPATL